MSSIPGPDGCPDCHVDPGQPHIDGCDNAYCTACGEQRIICKHRASDIGWGQIWNGPVPVEPAPQRRMLTLDCSTCGATGITVWADHVPACPGPPAGDAPLVLPRAAVESLHQLLGRLLEEDRAQSSTAEGDGICTATLKDPEDQVIRCAQPAGHYDGDNQPDPLTDDSPGGWHRSAPDGSGDCVTWADWATGTTPHKETP